MDSAFDAKVPLPHFLHLKAPVPSWYCPFEQLVHEVCFVDAVAFPASQFLHELFPFEFWNCPFAQAGEITLPAPNNEYDHGHVDNSLAEIACLQARLEAAARETPQRSDPCSDHFWDLERVSDAEGGSCSEAVYRRVYNTAKRALLAASELRSNAELAR